MSHFWNSYVGRFEADTDKAIQLFRYEDMFKFKEQNRTKNTKSE